ncbi:MAG: LysR family transcriptional regulator [Pandoraea sp.]|uniref:LysR family transcriptional regulator n=1 Tax=Pandoraea cepalis TaxID=2508294 RepID=A0AAW7MRC5_9BURK|nr:MULTISPECIES: LysR substrate-binding domain-containing protein [Pandoraea]MBN9115367.1 LysR family transcriptional regulator [Pandoraea sp.]MDN4575424.1 LysR family transcriptional regulator [Pandoraea cepalis]MDN4579494.1 LysR family transcriptional regulator [Pandoraea cepalis]OJY19095.1 MAG: LysR family transcriptional regulator [Pandoraea sp. 64-18]
MKFKQVEAFRAVIQTGSMTAAADALHTSQPNISRLVGQLEQSVGFRLFERINGRLQLTDEGAELFRDVERAFVSLKSLEDSAAQIRRSGTGRLRVGAVPSIALTQMPEVIRRFREAHPGVAVSLLTNDSPRVAQWVASQFCDLGVVAYVSRDVSGIEATTIRDVAGVCAFPAGHRLGERDIVTPADLEYEPFIALSLVDGTRMRIDQRFREAGVTLRHKELETPYEATVCAMVAGGLGVSIVSESVARAYAGRGLLDYRRFVPDVPFTTHLLRPLHAPQSLLAQRFADTLRAVVGGDTPVA